MRLDGERKYRCISFAGGHQFDAVIKIEVARGFVIRDAHLPPIGVVFIAIHDGPERLVFQRPPAGENAVHVHGIKRLPILAGEEGRHGALHSGYAARCLAIPRSHSVPDAPDVLPAFPPFSVEECELQVVGLIAHPAALNVDLVARLKPAIFIDSGNKLKLILAPRQYVP